MGVSRVLIPRPGRDILSSRYSCFNSHKQAVSSLSDRQSWSTAPSMREDGVICRGQVSYSLSKAIRWDLRANVICEARRSQPLDYCDHQRRPSISSLALRP